MSKEPKLRTSEKPCPKCGHPAGMHIIQIMTKGPHYARVECGSGKCGCIGWDGKPDDDPTKYKPRREADQKELLAKYSQGFCELCLIPQESIPRSESLEAHHVTEYQDGGTSDSENIWIVCTACHKLIHWRRTYLGHLVDVAKSMKRWEEPANGRDTA